MDKYEKLKCQLPLSWVLDLCDKEEIPDNVEDQINLYFENTFAQAFLNFFTENGFFRKQVFEDSCDGEVRAEFPTLEHFVSKNPFTMIYHEETDEIANNIMDGIRRHVPKYYTEIILRMSTIQRDYEERGPFPPQTPQLRTITYLDLANFLFPKNKKPFIRDLERSDIFESTMRGVLYKDFRQKNSWWLTKNRLDSGSGSDTDSKSVKLAGIICRS